MASPDPSVLADVSNALSYILLKRCENQWNRATPYLQNMEALPVLGKSLNWDTGFSGATACAANEGSDIGAGEWSIDAFTSATLGWTEYRSAFWVSDTEFDAAVTSLNSGDKLMALFGARIESAVTVVAQLLENDAISGTGVAGGGTEYPGAPTIVGLLGGALEASGTYANLSRSTYPLWSGNTLKNGGVARPLTIDLVNQLEQQIWKSAYREQGDKSLIFVDSGTWRVYSDLFEPLRRLEGIMLPAYQTGPVNAGVNSGTAPTPLSFQDMSIYRTPALDAVSPNGTLVMLRKGKVKLGFLPFSPMSAMDITSQGGTAEQYKSEGYGASGDTKTPFNIPFRIIPLARTGTSQKFCVYSRVQQMVLRPNSCGYISDISVA